MRLIVTRPEPDASRTAQALAALGHQPILSPMLDVIFDHAAPLPREDVQALLVTSTNAVRALLAHPRRAAFASLPLLAVGDRTALEAKRGGFQAARSAGGAVADLAALARTELDPASGPLLYCAGDAQEGDLAGRLRSLGFSVQTAVVYRAEARGTLSRAAAQALHEGSAEGVLLFSRRTAAAFALALEAEDLAPLPERVGCFCLSPAVAEPLSAVTKGPVRVAARPDQISLFALLEGAPPPAPQDASHT